MPLSRIPIPPPKNPIDQLYSSNSRIRQYVNIGYYNNLPAFCPKWRFGLPRQAICECKGGLLNNNMPLRRPHKPKNNEQLQYSSQWRFFDKYKVLQYLLYTADYGIKCWKFKFEMKLLFSRKSKIKLEQQKYIYFFLIKRKNGLSCLIKLSYVVKETSGNYWFSAFFVSDSFILTTQF